MAGQRHNAVNDDGRLSEARHGRVQRLQRLGRVLGASVAILGAVMVANAAGTSVAINANVIAVQCNAEQRLRLRACAPAQEVVTVEREKMLAPEIPPRGDGTSRLVVVHDPGRRVVVRTILY